MIARVPQRAHPGRSVARASVRRTLRRPPPKGHTYHRRPHRGTPTCYPDLPDGGIVEHHLQQRQHVVVHFDPAPKPIPSADMSTLLAVRSISAWHHNSSSEQNNSHSLTPPGLGSGGQTKIVDTGLVTPASRIVATSGTNLLPAPISSTEWRSSPVQLKRPLGPRTSSFCPTPRSRTTGGDYSGTSRTPVRSPKGPVRERSRPAGLGVAGRCSHCSSGREENRQSKPIEVAGSQGHGVGILLDDLGRLGVQPPGRCLTEWVAFLEAGAAPLLSLVYSRLTNPSRRRSSTTRQLGPSKLRTPSAGRLSWRPSHRTGQDRTGLLDGVSLGILQ